MRALIGGKELTLVNRIGMLGNKGLCLVVHWDCTRESYSWYTAEYDSVQTAALANTGHNGRYIQPGPKGWPGYSFFTKQ